MELKPMDRKLYCEGMSGGIKFTKSYQEARLRSPLCGFSEVKQLIEIRTDPLTGRRCRINLKRIKRPRQFPREYKELKRLVEKSREGCFFCPENIDSKTPLLSAGLGERIKVGRAVVFPNLFPFGGYHAVGIFSDDHYLSLDQLSGDMIFDCFSACLRYFELVSSSDASLKFWHINCNYMQPAASSIVHPHVQILSDPDPTPCLRELLSRSMEYKERTGSNYWRDLVEAERETGERYIGNIGHVHWLASYAPQASREVMGIVEGVSSLAELRGEMRNLCDGLSKIFSGYHEIGVRSMNFATFSGPADQDLSDHYWLNIRIISRPAPAPFHISDCGFMERLHLEPVIEVMPEDLASSLRKRFQ